MQETFTFIAKNYKEFGLILTAYGGLVLLFNKVNKHSRLLYQKDGETNVATKNGVDRRIATQAELCKANFSGLATKVDISTLEKSVIALQGCMSKKDAVTHGLLEVGNKRFERIEKLLEKMNQT